jgi:hypothetical protein
MQENRSCAAPFLMYRLNKAFSACQHSLDKKFVRASASLSGHNIRPACILWFLFRFALCCRPEHYYIHSCMCIICTCTCTYEWTDELTGFWSSDEQLHRNQMHKRPYIENISAMHKAIQLRLTSPGSHLSFFDLAYFWKVTPAQSYHIISFHFISSSQSDQRASKQASMCIIQNG